MKSHQRSFKSFWSDPTSPVSLGCFDCPDLRQCGGQRIAGNGFNCLDHCCKAPDICQVVCPEARVFADRVREVGGFQLKTPVADRLNPPPHVPYLPLLFHGSGQQERLATQAVAMPLYRFFDRNAGCRFTSREQIADAFKVETSAALYLSGVAQDHEVERWWRLEAAGRLKAIANFRSLGIAMVTTPNFSLMVDRPRWDDLHSMERIANVYHELVSEGQPAALHVNGRTERDFERWAEYIWMHPEVTHVAYEFTTGAKSPTRMRQHADWLAGLALASGRRLGLVLRGGSRMAPYLSAHFDVSFVDSSPFEKAQHREIAILNADGERRWIKRPTPTGAPIDALLRENVETGARWLSGLMPKLALAA